MGGGANRCGINFGCKEKGRGIEVELHPESGGEVDELEGVPARTFLVQREEDASGNGE